MREIVFDTVVLSNFAASGSADRWLRTWMETTGYYSPVDSIEELL